MTSKFHTRMCAMLLAYSALLAGCETSGGVPSREARNTLVTGDSLRVAIAVASAPSTFYSAIDSVSGSPVGVAVELGAGIAEALGIPVQYVRYRSSAEITAAAESDEWDVTFMPVDDERALRVAFGPPYNLFHSTFLVLGSSQISVLDDVNREGVRVGIVEGTTTGRSADRWLSHALIRNYDSVEDLRNALVEGNIDAIALSEASLRTVAVSLPSARILEGAFHSTANAVAVPKGRPAALDFVTLFVEQAKESGRVRAAFDALGLDDAIVAP